MLKELFAKKSQTVNNAIITLGDIDDSGKGKKFTSRFIQAGLVGYPNQFGTVLVKKETLDDSLKTIIGAPVIINHTNVTEENADDLRVGVISNAWYNNKDGWYWCEGVIWDETAQNLITDKKWSVSCSYDYLQEDNEGGTENNIPYDREFTKLNFVHLALVNNPRYERANIVFNSKELPEYTADEHLFFDILGVLHNYDKPLTAQDREVVIGLTRILNDKWVTIKGNHILIKDGESIADAFKRHTGQSFGKGNKKEPNKENKTSESLRAILDRVNKDNTKNISAKDLIQNAAKMLGKDVAEISGKIKEADEYNEGIKDKKQETYLKYSDANGIYTPKRAALHKEIIREIFKNAENAKPQDGEKPNFLVLGGRGGSGKSKFDGLVYDRNKYIVLDADAIKEMLPEYKGYNAFEVHEESSDILKRALNKAKKLGLNVVLDGTMKTLKSTESKITDFKDNGYNIEMYYMHLPREKAAERAIGRFMGNNGRYVPLDVLLDMKENENNFNALKKHASKWAFYNNDVAKKSDEPILVDKNY